MTRKRYKQGKFSSGKRIPPTGFLDACLRSISHVTLACDITHCGKCCAELRLSLQLHRIWAQYDVAEQSRPWLFA